jgi:peptidoglycan/LPS O-acetylase OafA/YrhL
MNAKTTVDKRRDDLDWLRVAAILAVFVYHSARFFDQEDWSVKNAVTYLGVAHWQYFLNQWLMPLIFVVSGASVYYAVGKSGPARFVWDKVLRLAVPLIIGAFTHASLQVYLERASHGQFQGSYFEFLPHYFEGVYLGPGTGNFAFHGMHLWYLLYLFLFTILLMPLFYWNKGGAGGRVLQRLGDLIALPGGLVLLAVPTILLENTLGREGSIGGFIVGGWNIPQYVWFFVSGFLIISHERVQERIRQARWVALALSLGLVTMLLLTGNPVYKHPDLASWCLILAILGFGMKHLTIRTPFLNYASEAVLPFYIFHQTVLLLVGFFVVQWLIPDLAKYALIVASSFLAIVLMYEYLVRRNSVLRFLFGMRPLRSERTSQYEMAAARTSKI